jgi:hypothetical protein
MTTRYNRAAARVLIHGIYDTVGITLLYLDKDHIFSEWIQQLF